MKPQQQVQLSDSEQRLLAREVAADRRVGGGGYYNDSMREVFVSGWDAAMEYVRQQKQETIIPDE